MCYVFLINIAVKIIFKMVNSLQCKGVTLNVLSNFNVILRMLCIVTINVFHTLPLFKCKCWPLKLVVVLMHGWQITQKAKLVAKKVKLRG